jgi:hypothetical protein
MIIRILQSAGKHPENAKFRECLCLQRAFTRLGVQTQVQGPGYPLLTPEAPRPNVLLVTENYSAAPWISIAAHPAYKVFWSIDSHCVLGRHLDFVKTQRVQLALVSCAQHVRNFAVVAPRAVWLPNAYPADLIHPLSVPNTGDVGFCGSVLNRRPWLDKLHAALGALREDIFVLGDDMVRAICSYRVHWNHSYRSDLNYRVFETCGCRTALLTDRVPGLDAVLKEGRECSVYTSFEDCVERARWLLHHETDRARMAAAGHARVEREHTYDVRARQILKLIGEGL